VSSKWFSFFTIIKEDWLISHTGVKMSKIKGYQMDLEEAKAFEAINPTTKHVTVTTAYTYTYEVARNFDIYDDNALTSLMTGIPVDEGVSGSTQSVRDCSTSQERTFTFEG
jgi:hypothetical protein